MSIKTMIRNILPTALLNSIQTYRKQWINFKTLAKEYNQLESIKKWSCINKEGNPIPWYTYPAIEYLSNLDFSDKTVLEWGGGNSSLFWAKRCKKLVTIESNPEWFKMIKKNQAQNQDLYFKQNATPEVSHSEFAHFPLTLDTNFDVFILDGEDRQVCSNIALEIIRLHNNQNALIIFDNSDWYQNTCKILRDASLIQVDFHGFAPINAYTHTTSIFLTRNFHFNPLNKLQPHYSINALHHKNDDLLE